MDSNFSQENVSFLFFSLSRFYRKLPYYIDQMEISFIWIIVFLWYSSNHSYNLIYLLFQSNQKDSQQEDIRSSMLTEEEP